MIPPAADWAFAPARLRPGLRAALARARRLGRGVVFAHTERVDDLPDPLELFASAEARGERRFFAARPADDALLLATGCAAEVATERPGPIDDLARRAAWLLADAEPASRGGPLLVGGIAFDSLALRSGAEWRPFGRARLTLPEVLLRTRAGRTEVTASLLLRPGDDEAAALGRVRDSLERGLSKSPGRLLPAAALRAPAPEVLESAFATQAERVLAKLDVGAARKVVLAAVERFALEGEVAAGRVLRSLAAVHPSCLVFAQGIGERTFLGATPERLVTLEGREVRSAAVASTTARVRGASTSRELARSPKERIEHRLVVEALARGLAAHCVDVEVPEEPGQLATGHALHLYTPIRGRLAKPRHVLDLVAALHPTPAVSGTPPGAALEQIRAHESFDRGWYAGPIGWLDAAGGGEFHVALRCALLLPGEARLYAGAGLVEGSVPALEAAETRLKLRAMREALEDACAS